MKRIKRTLGMPIRYVKQLFSRFPERRIPTVVAAAAALVFLALYFVIHLEVMGILALISAAILAMLLIL